jgi:hypothetical protein
VIAAYTERINVRPAVARARRKDAELAAHSTKPAA